MGYRRPGLWLRRAAGSSPLVAELQRDLRALGYLKTGLDGQFGEGTERAVRALQLDLMKNDGRGGDGTAPVALRDFNHGRVVDATGVVGEPLAACIEDLLAADAVPKIPRAEDPAAENRKVRETLRTLRGLAVPRPFLLAVLQQESNFLHFREPTPANADDFIVVGIDRNDAAEPDRITSRGYGTGQFTLFHHPPRPDEIDSVMLDPVRNVAHAVEELDAKFRGFVAGTTSGTRADDRVAEIAAGTPLRRCRYEPTDPRYMAACRECALAAPAVTVTLAPTDYHGTPRYDAVPDRAQFGCDWPYAVRRYNGSGVNSYHYQARVLRRLAHDEQLRALIS
jgi:hypothetical protein